ncbi:MAG: YbhB/YbcL family Raf kinase inhibitor-like protein [Acidobacteriaceae bacterium]|nr:YbhB/YbcL family Raf kinase inhibitor-like protein [Acidobacteriaceae bacterium]
MNSNKRRFRQVAIIALGISVLAANAFARDDGTDGDNCFRVTSTTFANDTIMPLETIHTVISNNVNVCSIDGSQGGNRSPELSWSGAPPETKTFVVTAFDVTAAFTHWGMYNIPGNVTTLPENAGVPGSQYGQQVVNDFFNGAEYDGPCPPANVAPFVHQYVFTVYALRTRLELPGSANFPANAETLYQALIKAGEKHHILASASVTGLYTTTVSPK